jgi:hypothetical protein
MQSKNQVGKIRLQNYDRTFTSLGELATESICEGEALGTATVANCCASLVAWRIASLYGPRFFLLYRTYNM